MKKIRRYDIYFSIHSRIIYLLKKCKHFYPLFKKILALKVIMHMCMKVKDRVKYV